MTCKNNSLTILLVCDTCGRKAPDVVSYEFTVGQIYCECTDREACLEKQAWDERPCCGGAGCEGCTPLWQLED